jgi:CBS domain-containing protein
MFDCGQVLEFMGVHLRTVNQLLDAKGNQIFSVEPTESVLRAIEIMATRHIGAPLVVMEEQSEQIEQLERYIAG